MAKHTNLGQIVEYIPGMSIPTEHEQAGSPGHGKGVGQQRLTSERQTDCTSRPTPSLPPPIPSSRTPTRPPREARQSEAFTSGSSRSTSLSMTASSTTPSTTTLARSTSATCTASPSTSTMCSLPPRTRTGLLSSGAPLILVVCGPPAPWLVTKANRSNRPGKRRGPDGLLHGPRPGLAPSPRPRPHRPG